jgi:hypothetical protein
MPNLRDDLNSAAQAHRQLRARHTADLLAKAQQMNSILPVLERVRVESPRVGGLAARILVDAEFYAGRSDAEGFRDSEELWDAYEEVRKAVSGEDKTKPGAEREAGTP